MIKWVEQCCEAACHSSKGGRWLVQPSAKNLDKMVEGFLDSWSRCIGSKPWPDRIIRSCISVLAALTLQRPQVMCYIIHRRQISNNTSMFFVQFWLIHVYNSVPCYVKVAKTIWWNKNHCTTLTCKVRFVEVLPLCHHKAQKWKVILHFYWDTIEKCAWEGARLLLKYVFLSCAKLNLIIFVIKAINGKKISDPKLSQLENITSQSAAT